MLKGAEIPHHLHFVYSGGEEELSLKVATSSSAIQLYRYVTMRRTSVSM